MTLKLYDNDSHLKEFTATVLACEAIDGGYKILLDQTAFFPEGGGQPADRGKISNSEVFNVLEENGGIYHYCDKPLSIGENVFAKLDWQTRFDRMQNHSGEHIISGIVNKLYGYDNVGFHLSDETVTLDFNGDLTQKQLAEIEYLANEVVWRNAEFRTYYPDESVLKNLSYRSKKEIAGDIRIVEIENCDICACCAPHVKSAGEIGIIKLLDTERVRGGIRIYIKCGTRALYDYRTRFGAMAEVSRLLCVKQSEIADGTNKLYEQLNLEKAKNTDLKRKLMSYMIDSAYKKDMAVFEDGLEIKELQLLADGLHKRLGGIRAVFSQTDNDTFGFAICGEENELSAFFADFKQKFSVKGGGRGGMVQGTVTAKKENLILYFKF